MVGQYEFLLLLPCQLYARSWFQQFLCQNELLVVRFHRVLHNHNMGKTKKLYCDCSDRYCDWFAPIWDGGNDHSCITFLIFLPDEAIEIVIMWHLMVSVPTNMFSLWCCSVTHFCFNQKIAASHNSDTALGQIAILVIFLINCAVFHLIAVSCVGMGATVRLGNCISSFFLVMMVTIMRKTMKTQPILSTSLLCQPRWGENTPHSFIQH